MSDNKPELLDDWIQRFRINSNVKEQFTFLANVRGESEAELLRKVIAKFVAQGTLDGGMDEIVSIVRNSMKDVLKPTEERLAAINAKTAIASATAMYTNLQVISNAGFDAKSIHEEARKKAVTFVRETKKRE